MMLDVKKPQPALLAERKPDHAAELDQFGFGEVAMHAVPESIVGVEPPGEVERQRADGVVGIGEVVGVDAFRDLFELLLLPGARLVGWWSLREACRRRTQSSARWRPPGARSCSRA